MNKFEKIDFECALKNYKDYWEYHIDRDLSDYEVVKLALRKQISIKPKNKYYISSDDIYTGVCQCKHFVGSFNWYCDKCGQRLDWS